jgi:hypothetical protein
MCAVSSGRFMNLPDAVAKANAEPATLLLQNLSADKPTRCV